MLGRRVSLVGLVQTARDRALAGRRIQDFMIEVWEYDVDRAERTYRQAIELADQVVQRLLSGQFLCALKATHLDYRELHDRWDLEWIQDVPAWTTFEEVVALAEQIDNFLSMMERGGPGAPLARDCRHDLDLLCVLADWCQDAGLPHAAAEARHLHALACSLYVG